MAGPDIRHPGRERGPEAAQCVAAIDLGAAKTACLIARRGAGGALEAIGLGAQRVRLGLEGPDQDYDSTVRALRVAVDDAERMAGETVAAFDAVYGGPGLKSQIVRGRAPVRGGVVEETAPRLALREALDAAAKPGRAILHVVPLGYQVDDCAPTPDPRGQQGRHLVAEAVVVSAPQAVKEGLEACMLEAGVRLRRIQAGPFMAGLGALSAEERAAGVVVIDLGAQSTGIAAFAGGLLLHTSSIAIGQAGATAAIAARLSTSFAAAERAKLAFGGLAAGPDTIEAAAFDGSGRLAAARAPRNAVVEPLCAHMETLWARVRSALAQLPEDAAGWRVALTGGGSQLPGLRDAAQKALGRPVRIAAPLELGAPEIAAPTFAALAGGVGAQLRPPVEARLGLAGALAAARRGPQAPLRAGRALGEAFGWIWRNV